MAFVQSLFVPDNLHSSQTSFDPFIMESAVALSNDSNFKSIVMLRDTGSAQSLILESVTILISVIHRYRCLNSCWGIRLRARTSTYYVHKIQSYFRPCENWCTFTFTSVSMILGNYLVGGKVLPCPVVSAEPDVGAQTDVSKMFLFSRHVL